MSKEKASRTETIKQGQVIAKDNLGNTLSTIGEYAPIFTLTDLLEILPKEIVYQELKHQIRIEWDDEWYADYVEDGYSSVITAKSEELIDALYELVVWCIENNYLINNEL